jgi:hypothetical protein
MDYFKSVVDGYILGVSAGNGKTKITESEYNDILRVIHNRPSATETVDYRLREDLTWEEYEVEPDGDPPVTEDIDDAEALNIILGGDTE